MKLKSLMFLVLILTLLIMPFSLAIDTQINLRAWKDHKVSVFVLKAGELYNLLNSYHVNSGTGDVSVIYSGPESEIKINVKVSKDGQTVLIEEFGEFSTGSPLYLQVIPGNVSRNFKELLASISANKTIAESANSSSNGTITNSTINETANSESATQNTSESNKSKSVTGQAVGFTNKIKIPTFVYFIILGVIIAGIIIFLIVKKMPFIRHSLTSRPIEEKPKPVPVALQRQLLQTQKQLRDAQAEISRLKNEEKIREVERRIAEEKREIERLKKGG